MKREILESASLLLQAFPLYMFVVVAALAACLPRAPALRVLLLAMLASVLANQALKALLRRPRPAPWSCGHVPRWGRDAATATSGMPSGHEVGPHCSLACSSVTAILPFRVSMSKPRM